MAEFRGVREKRGGIEIRWQFKGRPISRFINKTPTQTNLEDAARQRKKFIELCKLGHYEEETTISMTFHEVATEMLAYKATRLKQSTLDSMLNKLNSHWESLFEMSIDEIKLTHIRTAEKKLAKRKKPLSAKTIKNSLSDLRQVFNYAYDEEIIEENPCLKIKPPKVQKPPIDSFSKDEKEAILAALKPKFRLFYLFMLDSGMRTGEVQGLQWSDIQQDYASVERSIYQGEASTTKTHQARMVLLSPRTVALIKEMKKERFKDKSKWIFSPRNTTLPYAVDRSLTMQFKAACKNSGVRYRRPYQCRHTYATLALRAGVTPITVAKQIGDRLETMQKNYADVMTENNDRAELEKAH